MNHDNLREVVNQWLQVLDESSYYELLGILEIADQAAIQAAFHSFSQNFHPDNHRKAPDDIREGVTLIFKRGAEAYGVLRDPQSRAAYDLALSRGALRYDRAAGSRDGSGAQRGLETVCATAGGKLHARQAERALSEGDLEHAEALLEKAQTAEGINIALENEFRDLLRVAETVPPKARK